MPSTTDSKRAPVLVLALAFAVAAGIGAIPFLSGCLASNEPVRLTVQDVLGTYAGEVLRQRFAADGVTVTDSALMTDTVVVSLSRDTVRAASKLAGVLIVTVHPEHASKDYLHAVVAPQAYAGPDADPAGGQNILNDSTYGFVFSRESDGRIRIAGALNVVKEKAPPCGTAGAKQADCHDPEMQLMTRFRMATLMK